jgi:hypothetical protein
VTYTQIGPFSASWGALPPLQPVTAWVATYPQLPKEGLSSLVPVSYSDEIVRDVAEISPSHHFALSQVLHSQNTFLHAWCEAVSVD